MKEDMTMNTKGTSTYHGIIYPFDFYMEYKGSKNIAQRILSDWRFDEMCRKNAEDRRC